MGDKIIKKTQKAVRRRAVWIVLAGLTLSGIVVAFLLQMYQRENQRIFSSLVQKSLQSGHQSQVSEIRRIIAEKTDLLNTVAVADESFQSFPEEVWNEVYLNVAESLKKMYDVEYFPADTLSNLTDAKALGFRQEDTARLLGGETVISDVYQQEDSEDGCVFSITVPVLREGAVIGAFRSIQDADLLISPPGLPALEEESNILIYRNGDLIMDNSERLEGNLLEELEELGMGGKAVEQVKDSLGQEDGKAVYLKGKGNTQLFLVVSSLGYNDWMLLSLAYPGELNTYSAPMMKNGARLSVSLLLFLLALFGTCGYIFLHQRRKILNSQARYDLLSRFSDTILFEYDYRTKTMTFTPNIEVCFDLPADRKIGIFEKGYRFNVLHPDDIPVLQKALDASEHMRTDQPQDLMVRFRNLEGEYRWMGCQGQILRDSAGKPLSLIGKISDVHEQKKKEQRLLEKSSLDPLTGALNREAAQRKISRKLETGKPGFFFMVDADNFKMINDSMGHAAGDNVLAGIVREIKQVFRQEDVVGRIGGDEFIIYMNGTDDFAVARSKVEQLLKRLDHRDGIPVSVSIGIADFPGQGQDYGQLYEAADRAMYEAKHLGKCRYYYEGSDLCKKADRKEASPLF